MAEVLVATGLLATALVALAQLFALGTRTNTASRNVTFATVLAEQKLEQLRALTWGFDELGLPISDTSTDTTVQPEQPNGGTGLAPSPSNSLRENVTGYVDYLDPYGVALGTGQQPPNNAMYFRRWSVEPLPTNPNNTLILQVVAGRIADRGTAEGTNARFREEVRLTTVKTRKAR